MGGGGSQTIEQTFQTDILNEVIFEQITTNQNSLSSTVDNRQQIDFKLDGNMGPNCEINFNQKINATNTSSVVMSPETIGAATTAAQNQLEIAAQAAAERATELGNFQFGDRQNVSQNVLTEIENVIKSTFKTENINNLVANLIAIQDGELHIKGDCNGKIDFSQDIVATLAAEAITNSLTSAIADNTILNDLHASTQADLKMENKGFADIIKSLTGPWIAAIAGSVLLCCCIFLVLVIFLMSPGGQNVSRQAGQYYYPPPRY